MEKLRGIVLDNDFLDITPKAVATKEKNRNVDDIELRNCASKHLTNRVKGKAWGGRKRANHGSEKELISRIKNYNSTTKKQTTDLKNGERT